jgi:hypothetical protein
MEFSRRRRALRRTLGDGVEGLVHDLLGGGLLAVDHHLVDQLLDELRPVQGVGSIGRAPAAALRGMGYLALVP